VRRRAPVIASLLLPLALLLGCRTVPPPPDGEASASSAESARLDAEIEVVERLLALAIGGQTIGTVEIRLEKAPDGTWTTREHVSFAVIREGGGEDAAFSSTTESVTIYDPQREFVSEVEIEREAGITITRTITREGDELVSHYAGPGRTEVKRFALPSDYRSSLAVDFELIDEWRRTGEPATRRFSRFSASRERFEPIEVTLTGETEFVHGDRSIPAYVFRARDEDGTVVDTLIDHDLAPLQVSVAGTFMARLVDEAPTLGGVDGGRINAELPVTGTTTPQWWELAEQEVVVTVEGDDPEAASLWDTSHYHQVAREGSSYRMTLLHTRPDSEFVAPSLPLSITDPEVRPYLEPTAMAQSDNAKIIAEARRIVGDERDSWAAANKIVTAVYTGLAKQAGVRGSATATEVLHNRAGDCTEHAVLVVALMRAAGIPARAVDGIVLASNPDGSGVAGYHAWAEIWLGRWIGVDATVDETGTSARYLEFGLDEPGSRGSGGKMMRSIGKTTIELGPHRVHQD
jgi:hypothetical protein